MIKFKNDLIKKKKINNRVKKDSNNHYKRNKFKSVKDIRYLFNEKEDESSHEDTRYLFSEEDEFAHESPSKSIIVDITSNLSRRGHKLIKNGLKYVEEMKDLTYSQIKSFKEKLIMFNNDLIKKNKIKKNFNIIMKNIKLKVSKMLNIYLMTLYMKILDVCLIKLMTPDQMRIESLIFYVW